MSTADPVASPAATPIEVLIGVVTYNHRRFIPQCLDSLPACSKLHSVKVVLVDNRSSDGSADLVREKYPWVKLIERKGLHSFSNNNNVAFASSPCKYFLLLNPDTVVDEGALDILVQFMEDNPSCGLCGPKLLNPDGTLQFSCRRFPTFWSTLVRRTPFRALLPRHLRGVKHLMATASHDEAMPVDWMLGACLLIRSEAIEGAEPLDEGFPLYCEEIDLCLRLKRRGWSVFYVPTARVVHHHLAVSDSVLFSRASLLHARSMLYFTRKHYLSLHRRAARYAGVKPYQSAQSAQ
jgi:GT2 family glycosyltransferase